MINFFKLLGVMCLAASATFVVMVVGSREAQEIVYRSFFHPADPIFEGSPRILTRDDVECRKSEHTILIKPGYYLGMQPVLEWCGLDLSQHGGNVYIDGNGATFNGR